MDCEDNKNQHRPVYDSLALLLCFFDLYGLNRTLSYARHASYAVAFPHRYANALLLPLNIHLLHFIDVGRAYLYASLATYAGFIVDGYFKRHIDTVQLLNEVEDLSLIFLGLLRIPMSAS